MCEDNWRSLGSILADVTETALMKAMNGATEGSVGKRAHPSPPRSEQAWNYSPRSAFDGGQPNARGGLVGQPPMRRGGTRAMEWGGQPGDLRPDWPGFQTDIAGAPGMGLTHTSRSMTTVFCTAPSREPAPGSAVVIDLVVVVHQPLTLIQTITARSAAIAMRPEAMAKVM
jgi:hypothetical protein